MTARTRKMLLIPFLILTTLLAMPYAIVANAQEASPASMSLLAGLGLPELTYTVTDDGIEMAAEIAAGPVLITGTNTSSGFLTVDFVQLPAEGSVEEFIAVGTAEDLPIPAWASDLVMTAGFALEPGATGSVVALLAPGEYTAIASGDVTVANPTATLTVTGELAEDAAASVPSDLAVTLGEYVFDLPETVAAGPQVWQVTNQHEGVLHHIVVWQVDRAYTPDEVISGLMATFGGTPVADGFSFGSIVGDALGSPVLSYGQTVWLDVNLAPGNYVAVCFLPDPGGAEPHIFHGMVDAFEVPAA